MYPSGAEYAAQWIKEKSFILLGRQEKKPSLECKGALIQNFMNVKRVLHKGFLQICNICNHFCEDFLILTLKSHSTNNLKGLTGVKKD